MATNSPEIVIVGLGNTLHSDDGIGPRAVEKLRSDRRLPSGVAVIDGGTLGLELLPYVLDCSRLLVLDSVDVGQPPGTLIRMVDDQLATLVGKGSAHQLGVTDLLLALRVMASCPPQIILLGVQPATTEWGCVFSPPVAASLDSLVDAAISEIRSQRCSQLALSSLKIQPTNVSTRNR